MHVVIVTSCELARESLMGRRQELPLSGGNGKYRIQPNGPRGMAEYQPETTPKGRQARGRRRGLVSSHTARTIGLYPTYHHTA